MMDTNRTKEIVQNWFAAGVSSAVGVEMVADDFVWRGPISMAELFDNDDATQRGKAGLKRLDLLDRALYADFGSADNAMNVHFMIAERDICVLEFDATFTTHEGEKYHNEYCLVIRVADGKIAEVREHADTLYSQQVCMGTAEKRLGVLNRLSNMRDDHDYQGAQEWNR
jgi:uncharacterized protein